MKKIWKIIKKILKVFLLIIIALVLIFGVKAIYDNYIDVDKTDYPNAKTETRPVEFETAEDLLEKIHFHNEFDMLYGNIIYSSGKNRGMYVIPGLDGARTLNIHTGGVDSCTDMTPQGLAVSKNNIYVSMYCHKADHNSLLVVIDKTTGEFKKAIPLQGKPHVGGVAYDKNKKLVWISADKNKKASTICLTEKSIEEYDDENTTKPIEYKYEELLPELRANSFMTIKDDIMYVGYFSLNGTSVIRYYSIDDDGSLVHPENCATPTESMYNYFGIVSTDMYAMIFPQTQGMTFWGDNLILTRSYGQHDAKLIISEDVNLMGNRDHIKDHLMGTVNMPSYLESPYYSEEDGKLYCIFEGAAKAYRGRAKIPMDRIISLDIDTVELD